MPSTKTRAPAVSLRHTCAGRSSLLISSAARDRVKLAIDQLEEQFHVYDDKSSEDTLDSYEAALNRGRAMAFQEAAHYVKSALHDIDVKSL